MRECRPKMRTPCTPRPDAGRHDVRWGEGARLIRLQQTWQEYAPSTDQQFDLIYFDAFAPDSQPELWTEERLREAHELLAPDGILVTYCSKGDVRRAMKAAGLNVEKLPRPPGEKGDVEGDPTRRRQRGAAEVQCARLLFSSFPRGTLQEKDRCC